jgi:Icc-related predicted phosphoesterase
MKFLHITDIHCNQQWMDWAREAAPAFDAVLLSGDMLEMSSPRPIEDQIRHWQNYFKIVPGRWFVCSGNHDCDSGVDALWLSRLKNDAIVVPGKIGQVGDVSIGCAEYITSDFSQFSGVNLLVTHEPPEGSRASGIQHGIAGGSFDLLCHLETRPKTKVVVCGHVHRPKAHWDTIHGVVCLNPGRDGDAAFPNHFVIDWGRFAELRREGAPSEAVRLAS